MKKIEFQPPNGVVPEATQAGDDFDMVCSFRVKSNGDICLIKLGDTEMPGYDDGDEKGQKDYSDEAQAMQGMMQGGQEAD